MSFQPPLFDCPYGSCDDFGYCRCVEEAPDGEEQQLADNLAADRAFILRGQIRDVHTLPPLDNYEPVKGR
ncbi:hypothetical protein ME763_32000 [Streptomyces murinus]|uniref:hypothetical protein n=1 Tax=Streptomyces murinus TaxID=33900 RepID=UPI000A1D70F1|nr:hypothetical protein [Streptomyces murinus]WDO09915.1 hypothetical protein ME763_32000 [Streptomyces murinus]